MKQKLYSCFTYIKKHIDVIQIVGKLVLIFILIFVIYGKLDKLFKQKDIDYGTSFKSLPKNSMDIVVLGPSHSEFSFVPEFIYEDLDLYSYVLHSACQPLEISYLMLKESYKTQSPKLVILEVYSSMPHQIRCFSDSSYILPSYQMTGQERIDALNYLDKDKASNYYNDFNINHNNWRIITSVEDLNFNDYSLDISKVSKTFNYRPLYPTLPAAKYWHPVTHETDIDVNLEQSDLETLNNIYKLCKENDSELFLYATPMDSFSQEDQSYLHKVWEWAEEKNINYIDFFERSKTNGYYMHIHSDTDHACVNGAGIITKDISNEIKNYNYEFNHILNNDIENILIEEEYPRVSDFLKYEYDPYKYIERIKSYNGIAIMSYSGSNRELDEGFVNKIKGFDLPSDFDINTPCVVVFKNKQLIAKGIDSLNFEVDGHKIDVKGNTVSLDGIIINEMGPLSFTLLNNDYSENITKRVDYRTDYIWETGFSHYNE